MSRPDIRRLRLAGGIQEMRRLAPPARRWLLALMIGALALGNIAWLVLRVSG